MEIKILDETKMPIYRTPEEAVIVVAITYQADTRPPRTVWVDEDQLPDLVFAKDNPGKEIPASLVEAGDKVRKEAIQADLAAHPVTPPRTLTL